MFDMSGESVEFLAPVPSAEDYSVSADLWERLESEVKVVSDRIRAGENLVPDDVTKVRELKSQVDKYVTAFNKAMNADQKKYKAMVEKRLTELGYNEIEQFIATKRQEQTDQQNSRIAYKMDSLKTISDGLLGRTKTLKDVPMAKELLPAFTARFPKVQSGAKSNDIKDWKPYFSIMYRTVSILDTFFSDEKYKEAVMLPLHAGTIRELLAFVKDGKEEHLVNIPVKFEEDQSLIHEEKVKTAVKSKADGIEHIRQILEDMGDVSGLSDAAKQMRTEQAWREISLIVRLCNNV